MVGDILILDLIFFIMFQSINYNCSICKKKIHNSNLPAYFPHYVCQECDKRAVMKNGRLALQWFSKRVEKLRSEDPIGYKEIITSSDTGPNPVFIDGHKCWRRYRMGTWVTMKDIYNSWSLEEFEHNNFFNKKPDSRSASNEED